MIVEQFGMKIWKVKAEEVHQLLKDLKIWDQTSNVYPFGQFLHVTTNAEINPDIMNTYLIEKGHQSIVIKPGFSGIEDVFMDLMSKQD